MNYNKWFDGLLEGANGPNAVIIAGFEVRACIAIAKVLVVCRRWRGLR